jgi:replicative DNA helicase
MEPTDIVSLEQDILSCMLQRLPLSEQTETWIAEHDFVNTDHEFIYSYLTNVVMLSCDSSPCDVLEQFEMMHQNYVTDFYETDDIAALHHGLLLYLAWLYELSPEVDFLQNCVLNLDLGIYGNDLCPETSLSLVFRKMAEVDFGQNFLTTGIPTLDEAIGGIQPGKFYVIGGPPGSGKSFLLLQLALHLANKGESVCVFTLEMQREEIGLRLSRMISGASVPDSQTSQLLRNLEMQTRCMNYFVDDTARSIKQIEESVHYYVANLGTTVFFLDYFQLLTVWGQFANRTDELNYALRQLSLLRQELGIALVAASSIIIKKNEKWRGNQDMLGQLRDTSQLASDVDCVLFLSPTSIGAEYRELHVAKLRYKQIVNPSIVLKMNSTTGLFSEAHGLELEELPPSSKISPNRKSLSEQMAALKTSKQSQPHQETGNGGQTK